MPKPNDELTALGRSGTFRTTHWTQIVNARSGDKQERKAALDEIVARYWKPVYCYLRCKGYDSEAAQDVTQGFFLEVVLGRGLLQLADRAKGRFRTYLLQALRHYTVSVKRFENAKRRRPEGRLLGFGWIDKQDLPQPIHYTTPAAVFDYAWASALLDQVLAEVADECRKTGKSTHWEIFRAKILQPILADAEPPPLEWLCKKHGVENKARAFNMITTVKRRFQGALRRQVRQFVSSDQEVDSEILELMKIFREAPARK